MSMHPTVLATAHTPLDAERHFAEQAARQAGAVLLKHFGTTLDIDTKVSAVDPVSIADRESEQLIVQLLRASFPDDGIVGEEGAADAGSSGRTWVLDPLDGTVNYLYGRPTFAVSVALVQGDETLVGVVFQPVTDELTVAVKGLPTLVNGQPVRVSTPSSLALCLLSTGFSYEAPLRAEQGATLRSLLPLVRDIRRDGSAALDLAAIARGQSDLYLERYVRPWDIAAGVRLVEEAGGLVHTWQSAPDYLGVIAGSHDRVQELRTLLAELDASVV